MKKIIFYNYCNNGDIHVSRSFVLDIIEQLGDSCSYSYHHKNDKKILQDIKQLKYSNVNTFNNNVLFEIDDNIAFINTWYNPPMAIDYRGCKLISLYNNFKKIYETIGLKLKEYVYYIPKINFQEFKISDIDCFIKQTKFLKKIMVSNGSTLSGQCNNFNFDDIISPIADKFPDVLFIMTNGTSINKENVISSADIIKINENDLNENAYLSTFCDVIIGRASGTFTFSLIDQNLLGDKKQIYYSIGEQDPVFVDENFINKSKKFIWQKDQNTKNISLDLSEKIKSFYANC